MSLSFEQIQTRRSLGEENAVVVGLSYLRQWVVLLSKHAESGGQVGHEETGAKIF